MKVKQDVKFTQEEIDYLNYAIKHNISKNEISKNLNRSAGSISGAINRYCIKKDIKLFDGEMSKEIFNRYIITSFGRIFNHLNEEMKQTDFSGYRRITLSVSKCKKKKFFIHRLVAEAFLEKENGKNFINHKDMNRSNNNISNLEWVSQSENETHKFKNRPEYKEHLSNINSKTRNKDKVYTEESVKRICELLVLGLSGMEISRQLNIDPKRVYAIKNKKIWKSISDKYF